MLKTKLNFLLIFLLIFSSCGSKKNILYLQDAKNSDLYSVKYKDYKIQVDDILKIEVNSENPETSLIFNPGGSSSYMSSTKDRMIYEGYQVNTQGNINFPVLGTLKIEGLSTDDVRNLIYNTIKEKEILIDPSVDVKLLNSHFTILGEVNKPGRYEFLKNNMHILEAIGIAGDLTINGVRDDIQLIRESKYGSKEIFSVDLTRSDFLKGNNFQIFSGDIIIVKPNITRVKSSGIIGNSGTLISLLSFILTSIIVISN